MFIREIGIDSRIGGPATLKSFTAPLVSDVQKLVMGRCRANFIKLIDSEGLDDDEFNEYVKALFRSYISYRRKTCNVFANVWQDDSKVTLAGTEMNEHTGDDLYEHHCLISKEANNVIENNPPLTLEIVKGAMKSLVAEHPDTIKNFTLLISQYDQFTAKCMVDELSDLPIKTEYLVDHYLPKEHYFIIANVQDTCLYRVLNNVISMFVDGSNCVVRCSHEHFVKPDWIRASRGDGSVEQYKGWNWPDMYKGGER